MIEPLRPVSVTVRPTAAGRALIAATVVSLVLAWADAGIVCSLVAMLGGGLSVVAALSTRRHASALRIAAPPPVTAFAGERFVLNVAVTNLAKRAVAFDVLFSVSRRHAFGDPVGALLPRLPAGVETRVDVVYPKLRRGLHPQGTLELSSAFPLGLCACRLVFALPNPILVLPRLGTIRRLDRRGARLRGDTGSRGAGGGDEQEVYGVRAWRNGEAMRSVHWKLSARRGRLLVREFRNEPRPPVHVVLATDFEADGRRARDAFEEAVSFAATLVEHHVRRGHAVRLTLLGRTPRTIACRRGRGAVFPALRALAEAVPESRARGVVAVSRLLRRGEATYLVRVTGGGASPADDAVTVFDVDSVTVFNVPLIRARGGDLAAVWDRRRRPGNEALLGVRG